MSFVSKALSIVLVTGVVVGLAIAGKPEARHAVNSSLPTDRLGAFITELELPKTEAALVTTEKSDRIEVPSISDQRYSELDIGWRRHVLRLIKSGVCDKYDALLRSHIMMQPMFMYVKAQMIVESSCDPTAESDAHARGLFQLKNVACKDVGMDGDLYDPTFNVSCAVRYRKALCNRYKFCTLAALFSAYNLGPTAMKRVRSAKEYFYARKIDFVRQALIDRQG